jgi:hypothetical protein
MLARVLGVTGMLALVTASMPGAVFAAPAVPASKSKVIYRASFATKKLKGWDTQGTSWRVSKKGIVQFTGQAIADMCSIDAFLPTNRSRVERVAVLSSAPRRTPQCRVAGIAWFP